MEIKEGAQLTIKVMGDTVYTLVSLSKDIYTLSWTDNMTNRVNTSLGKWTTTEVQTSIDKGDWKVVNQEEEDYSDYLVDTTSFKVIADKDYEFYKEIEKLMSYLASTYSDKYEDKDNAISSKSILLSKDGKSANIFTASKYLQRYLSSGYSKSGNKEDLYKLVHYVIFELQRLSKHGI